jgi:hypothetical protein
VVGLILPLIIVGVLYTVRFLPTQLINLPRRDFWLAPERRDETCLYLARQGFWLASLLVLLQGMVWYQLIESNSRSVPQLSSSGFLVTLGAFGVALIFWLIRLFRHFARAA